MAGWRREGRQSAAAIEFIALPAQGEEGKEGARCQFLPVRTFAATRFWIGPL
jgi:hypothetical protein